MSCHLVSTDFLSFKLFLSYPFSFAVGVAFVVFLVLVMHVNKNQ